MFDLTRKEKRNKFLQLLIKAVELGATKKEFFSFLKEKTKLIFPLKASWEDSCLLVAEYFLFLKENKLSRSDFEKDLTFNYSLYKQSNK